MNDTYNTILSQLKAINNSFYERNEDLQRMERLEQIETEALIEFYQEYDTYTHQYIPYNYWGGISISDTDDEDNLY
jgi:hypothetical protein